MEREKFEIYIREVTSHVKFPFDRPGDLLIKSLQAWPHGRRGPVIQRDIQRQQTDFHMAIPVLSGIHTR